MKKTDRHVFKVREVMQLLKTGKEATLVVCSHDANRPEKSGRRLTLKGYLKSFEGFGKANIRLVNGDVQTFHPVLIEKYNGTTVIP